MTVGYSNPIMELANDLKSAGHSVSEIEHRRTSLKGLTRDFDVTAEAIKSVSHCFQNAVFKVIVRKTRLEESEVHKEIALMMQNWY